jgi:hypothetical protein
MHSSLTLAASNLLARGRQTRNVHLGSARKMDGEAARRKARERKAEALGYIDDRAWPGSRSWDLRGGTSDGIGTGRSGIYCGKRF